MAGSVDEVLANWVKRVEVKVNEVTLAADKAVLKAAFFCEGEAKKNAMIMIYNVSIPVNEKGIAMWKRTGLYKASIGSGLDPDNEHSAIVYNTAPYAGKVEYGSSDAPGAESPGMQGRPVMTNSVFNNKPQIKTIIEKYMREVVNK